jgi:hypothetical protein
LRKILKSRKFRKLISISKILFNNKNHASFSK